MLALKMPSGATVLTVPVTVTVLGTSFESMGRVAMVQPAKQVAQVTASIPVDSNGEGSAVVKLPLRWVVPAPPPVAGSPNKPTTLSIATGGQMTSYQLVLSSSLGGKSAPSMLGNQQTLSLLNVQPASFSTSSQPAPPPLQTILTPFRRKAVLPAPVMFQKVVNRNGRMALIPTPVRKLR
jgi:hypothetical protein